MFQDSFDVAVWRELLPSLWITLSTIAPSWSRMSTIEKSVLEKPRRRVVVLARVCSDFIRTPWAWLLESS